MQTWKMLNAVKSLKNCLFLLKALEKEKVPFYQWRALQDFFSYYLYATDGLLSQETCCQNQRSLAKALILKPAVCERFIIVVNILSFLFP